MAKPTSVRDVLLQPGRHQESPWAKLHKVEPNEGGWFDVTSARSGETYRVYTDGRCTCDAGKHDQPCTHVVAVREFAEAVLTNLTREKLAQEED